MRELGAAGRYAGGQCYARADGRARELALVAPGLQILGLKEQAVLLDGGKALRCCHLALDGERLVRKPKGLKLPGGNIHARQPLAAHIENRQAA